MKIFNLFAAFLVLLVATFGCVNGDYTHSLSLVFVNGTSVSNDNSFTPPIYSKYVTISVTTEVSVSLCFSPASALVDACEPAGFLVNVTTASAALNLDENVPYASGAKSRLLKFFARQVLDSITSSTNVSDIRLNRPYFVTGIVVGEVSNSTNSTTVQIEIKIDAPTCKPNEVYVDNLGCTAYTPMQPVNISNASGTVKNGAVSIVSYDFEDLPDSNPSAMIVSVNFTQGKLTADSNDTYPTILLRYAGAPSYNVYDAIVSNGTSATVQFTLNEVNYDTYFLLFNNTGSNSYDYSIEIIASSCVAPQIGPNCLLPRDLLSFNGTTQIAAGVLQAYNVTSTTSEEVDYYYLKTTSLQVGVAPQGYTKNAPNLYASINSVPGNNSNSYSDTAANAAVHFVAIADPNKNSEDYIYVAVESEVNYYIWYGTPCATNCTTSSAPGAQCSQCTNRGSCGLGGACSCNKHYTHFNCSGNGIALIWIILLAVGGAIVLALAIGIPVGCYIKNRKRARYERV